MAAKTAPKKEQGTIRVRATKLGFYGDVRRRPGDVFTLYPRTDTFSEVERDKKTDEPVLIGSGPIRHRVTKEVPKTLSAEEQFSATWMEKVGDDVPERASSARDVLQAEHDRVLRERLASQGVDVGDSGAAPTGNAAVLGTDD